MKKAKKRIVGKLKEKGKGEWTSRRSAGFEKKEGHLESLCGRQKGKILAGTISKKS